MLAVARADDERRALGGVRAQTADVIHVVMGEHEILHGLTGELRARGAEDPVRMPIAHRRVEHDQVVTHLDEQAVMGAADHVLDTGRQLHEPQPRRGSRIVARHVGVEVGADELSPDDPLIRHGAGRGPRRPRLELDGNREPLSRDARVDLAVRDLDLRDRAAVQLVRPGRGDAHVAPDVVIVERANARRQPRPPIEHDRERLIARAVVDGGIGDAADRDLTGVREALGVPEHLEEQQGRATSQLTLGGGEAQPRHRVSGRLRLETLLGASVAVDAGHVAGLGRDDLAEGERARRGIRELAHPIDPRDAAADVGDRLERRLACKAHLAAGDHRLLGLPLAHRRLHRERPDAGQCVGPSHRVDGSAHEVLAPLLHRRARHHAERDDEHEHRALHGSSRPPKVDPPAQYPSSSVVSSHALPLPV